MKIRRIKLKKLKNTRDLGGLPAYGGKVIRPHCLIRSGQLAKAAPQDIDRLINEYELGTVIDLRIEAEIREKSYTLPEGVAYINIPLLDKAYLGITRDEYSIRSWFNLFEDKSRTPEDIFYDMYELLVFGERSKKLIPEIFDIFLRSDKAVLWHCSAGKDRVGVVAMLILLALGVKKEIIIDDFIATNRFVAADIFKTRFFAPLVLRSRWQRRCLAILMGVKPVYMLRLFDTIEKNYDSVEDFFLKQFNISSATLEKLRNKFLTEEL